MNRGDVSPAGKGRHAMYATQAGRHARMSEVAERAGVSLSTVSRALRNAPGVKPDVRDRVRTAAEELSYVVSRSASGLVTGATGRVAVLVPFLRPWFFGTALAGLNTELRRTDLDMLVYQVGTAAGLEEYLGELPLKRNVDAVIALSLNLTAEEVAILDELSVPVVFVSQHVAQRPSVFVDNATAAGGATQHLINLGHSRIAFVRCSDVTGFEWSSGDRVTGYRTAMKQAGIEQDDRYVVVSNSVGAEGGSAAAGELLSLPYPPTAIFAESDDVAMGVLRVLRKSRLTVPDVMSVVGFDNHDMAEILDLSTVEQPVSEMGRTAARLVADVLAGEGTASPQELELPTQLIVRQTTAAPRSTASLTAQ